MTLLNINAATLPTLREQLNTGKAALDRYAEGVQDVHFTRAKVDAETGIIVFAHAAAMAEHLALTEYRATFIEHELATIHGICQELETAMRECWLAAAPGQDGQRAVDAVANAQQQLAAVYEHLDAIKQGAGIEPAPGCADCRTDGVTTTACEDCRAQFEAQDRGDRDGEWSAGAATVAFS